MLTARQIDLNVKAGDDGRCEGVRAGEGEGVEVGRVKKKKEEWGILRLQEEVMVDDLTKIALCITLTRVHHDCHVGRQHTAGDGLPMMIPPETPCLLYYGKRRSNVNAPTLRKIPHKERHSRPPQFFFKPSIASPRWRPAIGSIYIVVLWAILPRLYETVHSRPHSRKVPVAHAVLGPTTSPC